MSNKVQKTQGKITSTDIKAKIESKLFSRGVANPADASADQLYLALSKITGSTSGVETTESVAGGYQSDKILKQGSTSVYVPVYTPYYYKVADGVKAFYLNNIVGNETLSNIKIGEWQE